MTAHQFYRVDATWPAVKGKGVTSIKRRTYRYYARGVRALALRLRDSLDRGAVVTVRTISEAEYVKNTRVSER